MTPKTDSVAVLREIADETRKLAGVVADYGVSGMQGKARIDAIASRIDAAIAALSAQGEATYVVCRQCDHCGHVGINDEVETDAACHNCEWRGPSPIEDHCPACKSSNCMGASCPKCGALYGWIADTTLHPAPPGADAVTEEMVERFCIAYFGDEAWARTREHYNSRLIFDQIRGALTAALAARTGKGE